MPDLPDIPKAEIAIVEATNAFRRSEGLAAVRPNSELALTARLYAEYLARTGRFAHEADGRKPADRARAAGYRFCQISENLALNLDSRGFTTADLATKAVEGWKGSPGHRRNMVEPGVTEIGVGIARAPDVDPKYISVQLFGRPESLRLRFRVHNKAAAPVTYTAIGQQHTLAPNVIATHTSCQEGSVVFERAGNWLTGARIQSTFTARDGVTYLVAADPGGRISIDIEPAAPR